MHRRLASSLLGLASTLIAAEALADTAHVTDDAYVQLGSPSNSGSEPSIDVKNSAGGKDLRGFLRFDLSAVPNDAVVELATLRLFVSKLGEPGVVEVHRLTD